MKKAIETASILVQRRETEQSRLISPSISESHAAVEKERSREEREGEMGVSSQIPRSESGTLVANVPFKLSLELSANTSVCVAPALSLSHSLANVT